MMKRLVRWSCYIPRNGLEKYPNGVLDLEGIGNRPCLGALQERTYFSGPKISEKVGVGRPAVGFSERPVLVGNGFHQMVRRKHSLSREWFAKLWVADKKDDRMKEKGERRSVSNWSPFFRTSMFNARFREQKVQETDADVRSPAEYDERGALEEPPGSPYVPPTSTEEVKLAPLLSRSDLLITRDIEWANLIFAFEQESRYKIVDPCYPDFPVGSIHEQSNLIYRQLLRTRRPFIAYITDAHGDEIFRIRRPFWWINSTIYAEVDGKEIGVVHRRWHLWRRIYDLYLGKRQFAMVENPGFWNWTFTLKDNEEKVLAEINRDWRGFGFELFTDAGQYVIRFGPASSGSIASQAANVPELDIGRSLSLSERAVAVALAVSLDCDYFSRHSGRGMPFFIIDE